MIICILLFFPLEGICTTPSVGQVVGGVAARSWDTELFVPGEMSPTPSIAYVNFE